MYSPPTSPLLTDFSSLHPRTKPEETSTCSTTSDPNPGPSPNPNPGTNPKSIINHNTKPDPKCNQKPNTCTTWRCPFCSLENDIELMFCEMCTTRHTKAQSDGKMVHGGKRKLDQLKERSKTPYREDDIRRKRTRTKAVCRFFNVTSQSGCKYGAGCHFHHDRLDARATNPLQRLLLSLGLPVSLKGGTMCTAGNESVYCGNILSAPASRDLVGWSVRVANASELAPMH